MVIVLGVIPLFVTIANGYVIGVVSKMVVAGSNIVELWRLLPHGIFEIPAILISFALGMKLGTFVFAKKPGEEVINRFRLGLKVFLLIILPLLIIAAIIEGLLIGILG